MSQTVFNENYGDVTKAQLAAYRKHNISPMDHMLLCHQFGEQNRQLITDAVKAGWTAGRPVDPRG